MDKRFAIVVDGANVIESDDYRVMEWAAYGINMLSQSRRLGLYAQIETVYKPVCGFTVPKSIIEALKFMAQHNAKVAAIKCLRQAGFEAKFTIGLKEAKDWVEGYFQFPPVRIEA
jgi:hypothetical protein